MSNLGLAIAAAFFVVGGLALILAGLSGPQQSPLAIAGAILLSAVFLGGVIEQRRPPRGGPPSGD